MLLTTTAKNKTLFEGIHIYSRGIASLAEQRTQAAQAHNTRSYIVCFFFFFFFFLLLCERSAKCDMGHMLYYLTIELDHAKRDSRLATYGGVLLQRLKGLNL